MSAPEQVNQKSWLAEEEAVRLVAELRKKGVHTVLETGRRGCRVTVQRHTDLVALAKVCEASGLNVLYAPFGVEDGITIYAGTKP